MNIRLSTVALALLLAACGSDSKSEVQLTETQQQQVKTSSDGIVNAGADLGTLKTDPGGDQAFANLSSVFAHASTLWSTKMTAEAGAVSSGSNPYAFNVPLATSYQALTEGCYSQNGSDISYNCTDAGMGIVGDIKVKDDNIDIDLTLSSQGYEFIYQGSLNITQTSIDGYLNFDYAIAQTGMSFDYAVDIDYSKVMLDANGCAVGGSLSVNVDVNIDGLQDVRGNAAANAYDYPSVEVTFGPECGQVAMF